jgi:hypothetical protein
MATIALHIERTVDIVLRRSFTALAALALRELSVRSFGVFGSLLRDGFTFLADTLSLTLRSCRSFGFSFLRFRLGHLSYLVSQSVNDAALTATLTLSQSDKTVQAT